MNLYTFEGEELVQVGNERQWASIKLEPGKRLSYGNFKVFEGVVTPENKASLFIMPDHFSGSDYSDGSYITVANHRAFLKEFRKTPGVYDLYGGYGTFAIAISLLVAEEHNEIKEVLDSLEDYPIMNEEIAGEVESEWQVEAMKYIRESICRNINFEENLLPTDFEVEDNDKLEEIIWDAIRELDLQWSMENNSAYIDYEEIMPYVEDRILLDHCKAPELLVSRTWSCNQTISLFEQKLKGK
jgi:hypothetical protein